MITQIQKDLWIEALLSGKYTQTRCKLRRDDCFCALGVLCDVIDPKGWDVHNCWHGFPVFPSYPLTGRDGTISHLNDIFKVSFAKIAEWVDKQIIIE